MISELASQEAYHRMDAVGLDVPPALAHGYIAEPAVRSSDIPFLLFPNSIRAARDKIEEVQTDISLATVVKSLYSREGSVRRALGVLGLLEDDNQTFGVTYGSHMPFFTERLARVALEHDGSRADTRHLLTGHASYDTAREFTAATNLYFPGSTAVPIDLIATAHTSSHVGAQTDAMNLPFADGTFDTVQATNLLHMLVEPRRTDLYLVSGYEMDPEDRQRLDNVDTYFREVNRVLKPGGSLIMQEADIGTSLTGEPTVNPTPYDVILQQSSMLALRAERADLVTEDIDTFCGTLTNGHIFHAVGAWAASQSMEDVSQYIREHSKPTGFSGFHFIKP